MEFSANLWECENKEKTDSVVGFLFWSKHKNFHMICLHHLLLLKGLFEVTNHKFPEIVHTYLDSDRDFGKIEKVLRKDSTILTPA